MKGERQGKDTLYIMRGSASLSEACVTEDKESEQVSSKDETQLWHSMLDHVGQKGLDVLVKKGYIDSTKVSEIKFCEDCVIGKTLKVSFDPT